MTSNKVTVSQCRTVCHAAHQPLPVHLPQGKIRLCGLPLWSHLTWTGLRSNRNAQQRHHSQSSIRKTPCPQTNFGSVFQKILRNSRPGKTQFHAQLGRIFSTVLFPSSEGSPQRQHPHQQIGLHHSHRFWFLSLQRTRGTSRTREKSPV